MLVGLLVLYILFLSFFKPESVPALPAEARTLRGKALARSIMVSMVPPVVLIFLVLGTIFIGLQRPPRAARWAQSARWRWRWCVVG